MPPARKPRRSPVALQTPARHALVKVLGLLDGSLADLATESYTDLVRVMRAAADVARKALESEAHDEET